MLHANYDCIVHIIVSFLGKKFIANVSIHTIAALSAVVIRAINLH